LHKVSFRKITGPGQHCVESAGAVALAHDEAVARRIVGTGRVITQHAKVKRSQNVSGTEIASRMTLLSLVDHLERAAANTQRALAKGRNDVVGSLTDRPGRWQLCIQGN